MTGPDAARRQQPHIFGAVPQHYRRGTAVATAETPPWWSPELESDPAYPYSIDEWRRDVRRWMAATKVAPERQGPLLALSLGTTARTIADDMSEEIIARGALVDLGDGRGAVPRSGSTSC